MRFLDLLPQRCLGCGEPVETGPLCAVCTAKTLPFSLPGSGVGPCPVCGQTRLAELGPCVDCVAEDWSFPSLDGLFGYQEAAGELVRLYKFGGQTQLLEHWAHGAASRLWPPAPLVPVPSRRKQSWRRGWDPVRALTARLASCIRQPVYHALVRRPSLAQKRLDRSARQVNARQAYALALGAEQTIAGAPLLWLIDDVVTTGATVESCARLLKQAGAQEVRVFSLGLH